MFQIKEIKTRNTKVPQCDFVNCGIGMRHPFRAYFCSQSGGGKSTALLNLLLKFYLNRDKTSYFDKIYIFSKTKVSCDPIYECLHDLHNSKGECVCPDYHFFDTNIQALRLIMSLQEKDIKEKGLLKSDKICIVFDDFISDVKFTNQLKEIFIACRKFNVSTFTLSHAFHAVHKTSRLQQSCIFFWKSSAKDIEVCCFDYCAPNYSKQQFMDKINYATNDKYSFFFIDLNKSIEDGRYRKNLEEKII